jgi:uncharacterized protein
MKLVLFLSKDFLMIRIISVSALALLLSGCAFNGFYYFPDTTAVKHSDRAQEYYLEYEPGKKIHTLFFRKTNPIASVFILHGNAGNLQSWQDIADMLWEHGYQTYIIDYPGFGNSDGKAKHKVVLPATQVAFDHFIAQPEVSGTKKIILGFSLGANLAAKIGPDNQENLDAMVIEGAFNNYRDIGIDHTPKVLRFAPFLVLGSKFKGEETIRSWTKPLLVVHSKNDNVCPYWMGEELYNNAGSTQKELWTIEGPHISGFGRYTDQYFEKIERLVNEEAN